MNFLIVSARYLNTCRNSQRTKHGSIKMKQNVLRRNDGNRSYNEWQPTETREQNEKHLLNSNLNNDLFI